MALKINSPLTRGETLRVQLDDTGADSVTVRVRGPIGADIPLTRVGNLWTSDASTSDLNAGEYSVEAWATTEGVVQVVERGRLTVNAAPSVSENFDPRSTAERIVEAIDAHMSANGQDPTWSSYRINNRELRRYSIPELIQLRNYYSSIAAEEKAASRGRRFGPPIRFYI